MLSVASATLLTACSVSVGHGTTNQPATSVSPESPTTPVFITAPGAAASLPFSEAVRVGNILYLSGKVGADPATNQLVPGGIGPETRQALENIRTTLEANGSSLDRVFKCQVFLADMKEWPAMNAVYVTFFPNHRPARSAFGATGLALNARTEIECAATVAN
jgi:reactive intermediate/imine deaminase